MRHRTHSGGRQPRLLPFTPFSPFSLFTLSVLLLAGCTPSDSAPQGEAGKRLAGMKLQLVVVDDPAIAAAVRRITETSGTPKPAPKSKCSRPPKRRSREASRRRPAGRCRDLPRVFAGPAGRSETPGPRAAKHRPRSPRAVVANLRTAAEPGGHLGQRSLWRAARPTGLLLLLSGRLVENLRRKPPRTWKEYEELARLLREQGAKYGEEIRDGRAVGPRLGGARAPGPGRGLRQRARQLYDAVR